MRRESDLAIAALPARIDALEGRVTRFESGLQANTDLTQRVFDNTKSLIEGVQAATSFWSFMSRWASRLRRWTFQAAKFIGAVTVAITGTWAVAKGVFNTDLSIVIMDWWHR